MCTVYIQDDNGNTLFNTLSSFTTGTTWAGESKYISKISGVTGTKNIRFKGSGCSSRSTMIYDIILYKYS